MMTHQSMIEASRRHLIDAASVLAYHTHAVSESRRRYGTGSRWRSVVAGAARSIRTASLHNLTVERPYRIITSLRGERMVCGLLGGECVPLYSVRRGTPWWRQHYPLPTWF